MREERREKKMGLEQENGKLKEHIYEVKLEVHILQ